MMGLMTVADVMGGVRLDAFRDGGFREGFVLLE